MERHDIQRAYVDYWLQNGKKPVSVFAFCQSLSLSEVDFYDLYSSFDAIEKDLWRSWFEESLATLKADETYARYSVRDKLSAFYFTWVQHLRQHRSYILLQKDRYIVPGRQVEKLDTFRTAFYEYINELLREGYQSGEVKERKFISDQFVHGFWVQALFVLRYWIKDDSARFEMTDAAIDKAVTLSFQLIGTNTLDSIIDFGKFVFQRK